MCDMYLLVNGSRTYYAQQETYLPSVSGIFLLLVPASANRTTTLSFLSDLNRMRPDSSSSSSSSSDSSFVSSSGRASFSTWRHFQRLKTKVYYSKRYPSPFSCEQNCVQIGLVVIQFTCLCLTSSCFVVHHKISSAVLLPRAKRISQLIHYLIERFLIHHNFDNKYVG